MRLTRRSLVVIVAIAVPLGYCLCVEATWHLIWYSPEGPLALWIREATEHNGELVGFVLAGSALLLAGIYGVFVRAILQYLRKRGWL